MTRTLDHKTSDVISETANLPILPLKGVVVYPYLITPLMIQDAAQTRLVDEALMRGSRIGLFLQKNPKQENPGPNDLYHIGTAGNILKMLRFPDGTVRFLVQGLARIKVKSFATTTPHLSAEVVELADKLDSSVKAEALQRNVLEKIKQLVDLAPYLNEEFHVSAINQDTLSKLTDFIASYLNMSIDQKQLILEETDVVRRTESLYAAIIKEIEVLELSQKIQASAANELGKNQRDFILREQMKAIRRELGDGDDKSEIEEFEKRIAEAKMTEVAEKAARKELERMNHMAQASAEYTVSRTYLDWLVSLPWERSTKDILDLNKAKRILDEDHYNLEKVKDRILEYLAVRKLKSSVKGPILCFVGPPGVGKTSLGKSIARAMGREFARVSLGGMRDEAEIRGHRRTYIGSMPGRILQSIRRCNSNNPVIMLDEIDKLGTDFRGDPASALLEVLDPEQNDTFSDHYLDVPFDLSRVMFITTANWSEPIPPVLRDRMEMLYIAGYTDIEKLAIAKRHLIPKQLENHGVTTGQLVLTDSAVQTIIDGYTREAGLRNLEREIAAVTRKVARKVASGNKAKSTIDKSDIAKLLGAPRFTREALSRKGRIGVAPGLAYTSVGGELLFVEATAMQGKNQLMLTGHLGNVMKESAQAAMSYIRSNCRALGIPQSSFEGIDVHIHVPSGAIPKDGPSAGITMAVALASMYSRRAVKARLGMTGEVTLRGELLPIGGLREKLLAALRAGIETVIIPEENRKDMAEIPAEIKRKLKFKFFSEVAPAITCALVPPTKKAAIKKAGGAKKKSS